ncbi:MAG: succinate dehydrogenase [Isosphaeraceae bacterium]|nr:succinate dehydrogenase [Isosphaeraceae bacterium]
MSQTFRGPRVYRRGAWSRFVEGLRYGGGIGQRLWLVHRVTGLGILLYLFAHITDTFFVVVNPAWYDHAMHLYGGWVGDEYYWPVRWAFRIGELGLIACVLFHSINGLRVVLFDFWPKATHYQRPIFWFVLVAFWGIFVPVAIWVLLPLLSAPEVEPVRGTIESVTRA